MKRRYVKKGIIYKECSNCRQILPESEFNLKEAAPDKLQCYCKSCNKAYCLAWQHAQKR